MKILLSGGGDPEEVIALDEFFAKNIDKNLPILYLPVALEAAAYPSALQWFRETYAPYGITRVEMCTDPAQALPDKSHSAVFIGGGNTFKLWQEIKASGLDIRLRPYLREGGLLYGGSAGAIICGKTIEPALHLDSNGIGLTDFSALDLLGGADVYCHYTQYDAVRLADYPRDLYLLSERSGLLLDENGVSALGEPFRFQTAAK